MIPEKIIKILVLLLHITYYLARIEGGGLYAIRGGLEGAKITFPPSSCSLFEGLEEGATIKHYFLSVFWFNTTGPTSL